MKLSKLTKRNLIGYSFLAPWLSGMLLFTIIPIVFSLYLSFTQYDLFTPPRFVGLRNFRHMFLQDSTFWNSLTVTLTYVVLTLPLELCFALFIAMVLHRGIRGIRVYRAVYYVPSLFGSSVAVALLWRQVFGLKGIVNQVLGLVGITGTSWIANPDTAIFTLVLLRVWQFGSPMLIFLAGLQQVPDELYQAASIDGAGSSRRFFSITLPLLTPIILFNTIMQTINAFKSFTPAYIVSGGTGAPAGSLLFYTLYLYEKGFRNYQMGLASAMAWFLLAVVAFLTSLTFASSKKWVYYEK